MPEPREQLHTEQHTVDWEFYRDPADFAALTRLNAGELLRPLASLDPVESLHPFVRHGLALMSTKEVKKVIEGHVELGEDRKDGEDARPSQEFLLLLARFKTIKCSVAPNVLETAGYPLSGDPKKSDDSNEADSATEQRYFSLLFSKDDGSPNFDAIPEIIAENPKDPETTNLLVKLLKKGGIDIDNRKADAHFDDFATAIGIGYAENLLTEDGKVVSNSELKQIAENWIRSLDTANSELSLETRLTVISAVIDHADPYEMNYAFALDLIKGTAKATWEMAPKILGIKKRERLVTEIREIIMKKMSPYVRKDPAFVIKISEANDQIKAERESEAEAA